MLRRELFCRKPQLVGGGGDRSGGGGTPSARARGGSPSPRPPPLPPARFYQKDGKVRERSRFPAPTVPRYDSPCPQASLLPSRPQEFPPCRRLMLSLPVGPLLSSPPPGLPPPPTQLLQRWRGREGDPGRPQGGRSAAAGADITRPKRPGRFAPMPTRHAADKVQSS